MIDCSSGGIGDKDRPQRMKIEQGFLVPFAAEIGDKADIAAMAVGFLWDHKICDALLSKGQADMGALAREVLDDLN